MHWARSRGKGLGKDYPGLRRRVQGAAWAALGAVELMGMTMVVQAKLRDGHMLPGGMLAGLIN